ncbi:rod shape-determining protein MreC [Malonomonas rubra]|uniref:rod shape-determining protein MreC n=1 Tax=Malonomonas rubra TaxID=57040 RepID=UPI0026F0FC16|nr:rod shape-determining protein MreC [Malonomonas rubra]
MRDLIKRYRNLLLAAALLIATLLLYSYNLRQKDATTFFERAVLTLASPFQSVIDNITDGISDGWQHYLWLVDTEKRNDQLEQENSQLHSALQQVEEFRLQNERLRKLLAFVDDLDRPALPAQVIGEDVSSWARTVTIDKGSRAGLRAGLPVVAAEGVVGRIIKAAPNSSRVLLVTDASSAIAAMVQRTRTRGVVRGLGAKMSLDYALRGADIERDDLLVSSGMGGVFPKGLPLGKVSGVERDQYGLFQWVEVSPAVDFSHLEEVLVIVGEDQ